MQPELKFSLQSYHQVMNWIKLFSIYFSVTFINKFYFIGYVVACRWVIRLWHLCHSNLQNGSNGFPRAHSNQILHLLHYTFPCRTTRRHLFRIIGSVRHTGSQVLQVGESLYPFQLFSIWITVPRSTNSLHTSSSFQTKCVITQYNKAAHKVFGIIIIRIHLLPLTATLPD